MKTKSTSTSGNEMKAKFQVGDMVAIYYIDIYKNVKREIKKVKTVFDDGKIEFVDGYYAPQTNCRKLKPKKKLREVWLNEHNIQYHTWNVGEPQPATGYKKFKECK